MRSKIVPVKKVAKMLRGHRTLLLNWFRAKGQISAGAVEGFNGKAKLVMKRAYGLRSYRTLEIALYHTLGNLPELKSTTDSVDEANRLDKPSHRPDILFVIGQYAAGGVLGRKRALGMPKEFLMN